MAIEADGIDLATSLVNAGYADWERPPAPAVTTKPATPAAPAPAPSVVANPSNVPLQLTSASDDVKTGDVLEATIVYHAQPGQFFVWKVDDEAIGLFATVSDQLNRHFAASQPDPEFTPTVGELW